ncbi:uncharacterized protein LOC110433731 [Sorghum bicolor]|uniref:uncharacterized protein LOC110433731 n=1 Tax=Sorghum bicolor TaxID=4558 RepID=UPI000B426334|nr:uncharacterized protein LOC110433731 [Sorghum bicolor]|eukprot:XP_021311953.1 uncharacterized protein LOC110433731 [Sorghum bicolor]
MGQGPGVQVQRRSATARRVRIGIKRSNCAVQAYRMSSDRDMKTCSLKQTTTSSVQLQSLSEDVALIVDAALHLATAGAMLDLATAGVVPSRAALPGAVPSRTAPADIALELASAASAAAATLTGAASACARLKLALASAASACARLAPAAAAAAHRGACLQGKSQPQRSMSLRGVTAMEGMPARAAVPIEELVVEDLPEE